LSSELPVYAKFTKLTNGAVGDCENGGNVQETSNVPTLAPPVLASGRIAAVQTSNGERNKLKSSTSRLFLPSRKRTLTALAVAVELTTDMSVLYALPKLSARVV